MSENRIKYRHLQCFLEIVQQGSVIRAADVLSLTQPAVSKTLKELEEILDARLLERNKKGIELTKFGHLFLEHASTSLAALREGTEKVAEALQQRAHKLSIGVLPTVATSVLPSAVKHFRESDTTTRLHLSSGPNALLMSQLRVGELDLVVGRLGVPEAMAGLHFEHLYSEQIVFAVRPSHPLVNKPDFQLADICDYPILYPPQESITAPTVDAFLLSQDITNIKDRIDTVSDSFGKEFIRNNDAIWAISRGVVAREIESKELCELPIDTKETLSAVGLTTRSGPENIAALGQFIEAVKRVTASY
ncbi:pca operon transcription factor PcaQ [Marinomonas mediterranea]|jgi:pca operon transcription factor PcaQ|uniref:Transcriptional regulator, LysR family n=1 Tax=Marinomonas mediterranea (strain ATCC 700492 / JCM 21426 / NBRC 103028 / MMB-1) TaxID=717774 RepID=F2K368_MARM1|nr:pca operon transcription factor PcaQ [Marinomonas mediterranea]ADZ90121.1 transcriptional regulator, LysR family [Marinomonas mediterranea MMB-1]WCN08185.1 pca operon transcription factor PcaQ [Marinomonas mediterranea]WCN12252.1 pca operon transcription factor PcaQ [Marinomonas mediterranea]WCN16325.1 pca operon transcription factor PcaQ [Marinomonas mediterranea MMB-1]